MIRFPLAIVSILFLSLYVTGWYSLRNSELTTQVINTASELTFIKKEIGNDFSTGVFDSYLRKNGKGKSTYIVEFSLTGENGSGIIQARGSAVGNENILTSLHLFTKEGCFVYRARKDLETVCKGKRSQRWQRGRKVLGVF